MTRENVGFVLDGATPLQFSFKVEKGLTMPLHEYVVVEVGERKKVLAEVVNVGSKNPLALEKPAGEAFISDVYSYEIATVEVLGYLDEDGKISKPKIAPKPNTIVYKASDDELQKFYSCDEKRIPIFIGTLLHRSSVKVPVFLQDLSFHLGVFAQTRGGKSYLAGVLIEEILTKTYFPTIVIDVHGDYVMMDRFAETNQKHNDFNVTLYYPPGAPEVPGVTAEVKELKISLNQVENEAFMDMLGRIGELQEAALREILEELKESGKPFGFGDLMDKVKEKSEREDSEAEDRRRFKSLYARIKDAERDVKLPAEGLSLQELLQPKTLSIICLRGLRSKVQDAYTAIIVDLIFNNQVKYFGKEPLKAPPTFLFIEEAHRVASKESSRYAVKALSTAIREGAKFGLYLCLISQRPRSISPEIMANVGNYAVLRITNNQDQSIIESASESFSHRLVEDLPALNQGEAVLVGPYVPIPAVIKTQKRKTIHFGATPNLLEIQNKIINEIKKRERERW
ncbi:ATP-binding protein [Candidatus Bathyarchaeota archaeon]|nr:ATP-binding protein [Candidatus Bathyarchaeota archaeon]